MRKLIDYTTIWIIILLASCNGEHYPQSLRIADALANEDPDSAVVMLDQMSADMAEAPEAVRRYYQLLRIKADDKTDQMNVSTDSILEVVRYFEQEGDRSLLPTAYYYAGRVYSDNNDAPVSLSYFQKALDAMEGHDDLALKSVIYSQMGYLYLFQSLFDEAEKSFRTSYDIGVLRNDTTCMIWGLRDLGTIRQWKEDHKECIKYLRKAYKLAKESGDIKAETRISRDLTYTYSYLKEYGQAKFYIQEPIKNIHLLDSSSVYETMANIYYNSHEIDSFLVCAKQLEKVGDVYAKEYAYNKLTDVYLKRGDIYKAREYYDKFILYNDSTTRITKSNELQKVHFLYDLQKKEAKNNKLKKDKQIRDILIVGLFFLFLSVGLFIYNYFYHKQKKDQERIAQLQMIQRDIKQKSEATIIENNRKIAELEKQMSTLHEGQQQALEKLEAYKKRYQAMNAIAQAEKDRKEWTKDIVKSSAIYHTVLMRLQTDMPLNNTEWQQIETVINENYPDFKERLYAIYNFSSYEYHLCLLTKMGFSPYQIATLTAHTRSSVTHTRKRLYSKSYKEPGTGEQWDDFINSL